MQDLTSETTTTLLDRYVALWNEADPERRRAGVARLYAEDGRIVTPSVEVHGRDAIVEHIGEVFAEFAEASGHRFRRTGSTGHHRSLLIRWKLTAGGQQVAGGGLNVLFLGPDGRIGADHQFSEPQPPVQAGAGGR
jgi:uncharacterized protein